MRPAVRLTRSLVRFSTSTNVRGVAPVSVTSSTVGDQEYDDGAYADEVFECTRCDPPVKFRSAGGLRRHQLSAHEGKKYPCGLCNPVRFFSSPGNLRSHVLSIHEGVSHECKVCGQSFSMRSSLTKHLKVMPSEHSKPDRSSVAFSADQMEYRFFGHEEVMDQVATHNTTVSNREAILRDMFLLPTSAPPSQYDGRLPRSAYFNVYPKSTGAIIPLSYFPRGVHPSTPCSMAHLRLSFLHDLLERHDALSGTAWPTESSQNTPRHIQGEVDPSVSSSSQHKHRHSTSERVKLYHVRTTPTQFGLWSRRVYQTHIAVAIGEENIRAVEENLYGGSDDGVDGGGFVELDHRWNPIFRAADADGGRWTMATKFHEDDGTVRRVQIVLAFVGGLKLHPSLVSWVPSHKISRRSTRSSTFSDAGTSTASETVSSGKTSRTSAASDAVSSDRDSRTSTASETVSSGKPSRTSTAPNAVPSDRDSRTSTASETVCSGRDSSTSAASDAEPSDRDSGTSAASDAVSSSADSVSAFPTTASPGWDSSHSHSAINERFQCPICDDHEVKSVVDLRSHFRAQHMDVQLGCSHCSEPFTQEANLRQHEKYAHQGVKHYCKSCSKVYSSELILRKHEKSVHKAVL